MLKRFWALALMVFLLMPLALVFTSCGNNSDTPDTSESTQSGDPVDETDGTTTSEPIEEKTASIKFSLFSDFHYKVNMYMSSVEDMDAITKRANDSAVDFMMQTGDFCNDYIGSPEITNAYLKNQYGIPAYGVYGNHELETSGTSMNKVTPLINSELDSAVWGTSDGKLGDGSISYYYFEVNGFRMICLDTNYSYNPTKSEWEHNRSGTSGPPSGNTNTYALGPTQEEWLKKVLNDAADRDIPCLVFSHIGFSGVWSSAYNHAAIRALFSEVNQRVPGTVMACFSGHLHTNRGKVIDGIYYMDVNTVRNGCWRGSQPTHHYTAETFLKVNYDAYGNPVNTVETYLTSLSQAKNTWFFTDPLSCIITVSIDGKITIEGMETTWYNNVVPSNTSDALAPKILSGGCMVKGKKIQ